MNYAVVGLAVILIFVLFIMYRYFFTKKTSVIDNPVDLNSSNSPFSFKDLTNPTSSKNSYHCWIYLKSKPTSTSTSFSSRTPQINMNGFLFSDSNIQIVVTSKGLEYIYYNDQSTKYNHSVMTFEQSLPIQQWFHFCIVINDINNMDTYINGKLTTSNKPIGVAAFVNKDTSSISLGSLNTPAYLAGLQREDRALQPNDVYEIYMKGNNDSFFSKYFLSYGLSLVKTKNQVDMKQYAII